ncbi:MAG: excinuclease ABC subunit UvrC [Clostridiaceae bacterium]|nr:excinuclease ABC subunit UvrC [Eubacteriales bacterium]
MDELFKEKLALLPDQPGVYKMFGATGEVIYVGKAVNLKNRVRQYFQNKNQLPKVAAMVAHVADFEYILTANETEALTLESNLIKAFQPRYNILLKDDKHFPYVRLDIKQAYPRFEVVRSVKNDGARYYGPYLSGMALRDALTAIREMFPVRHCSKDILKAIARRERPCLMYHLGKCCAPCTGNVSREEYHALLDKVGYFLEGHTEPVIAMLTEKMNEAASNMEFERAAQLRDRIAAVRILGERQQAIAPSELERDVFAFVRDEGDAVVFALLVRKGKVVGTKRIGVACGDEPAGEIMRTFLQQYYMDAGYVPREIVVRDMPEDAAALTGWLRELRGKMTSIVCPQRGEKRKLAEMAYENGLDTIKKARELEHRAWERGEGALARLCEVIGLETIPERMECYDNSHIRGRDTVSGMVVFQNGKPAPTEYRRFRIKGDTNGDDYLAMREVLTRRFTSAREGDAKFTALPDLLVVDGGRGQLNVALEVLEEQGYAFIPAIGLAERSETILLRDVEMPVALDRHDPALHVLQRIRDEAHRFAITYHRSLRSKNALYSVLGEIPGVGPKRRRALFDTFITLDAIKAAEVEALMKAPGVNRPAAEAVYKYFHKER